MELRAAHDEGGEQVEGVGGVGCGKVGDLFVDELVGLGGDVAADQGGLEDVEGDVLAGCAAWLDARVEFGGENGFRVFCVWRVCRRGLICSGTRGLGHEAESEDVGGVELLVGELAAGEGVGEVETVDEGGGVHPVVGGDVVAGGRKRVVEAHAHGVDGVDESAGIRGIGRGGAEGGGEELHRRFHFVAEVFSGVELGRLDEGAEDGFDVAVGGEVGGGHAVDEGGRRVVGDEALG